MIASHEQKALFLLMFVFIFSQGEPMKNIGINIEIDPEILSALNSTKGEFSDNIKLWAAITLFQFNKLSISKAAHLADMHRYDFEKILAAHNIPISNLGKSDGEKDLEALNSAA